MACRKRFIKWAVSKLILSIIKKTSDSLLFIIRNFYRFGTGNDFILKVAPLRDRDSKEYRNYFPMPGYGVPVGKKKRHNDEAHDKYGLFLWPDRLYQDVWRYVLLILCTLIPFVFLKLSSYKLNEGIFLVACIVLPCIALLMLVIFILYLRTSPPVLSEIWAIWPESQYGRFLNVPHLSELTYSDKKKADKKYWHKYWHPDEKTSLKFQPSYYRADKNTLQEVLLHLSMFNFLFEKCGTKNIDSKEKNKKLNKIKVGELVNVLEEKSINSYRVLKREGWFYLFCPAVISYLLLIVSLFISVSLYPTKLISESADSILSPIVQIPYFYIVLIVIWSIITLRMILKQIDFLERLQRDVREGYYDSYLGLVPQQILKVVSQIPSDSQISEGIKQVTKMMQYVQAGALLTFLGMLEIFSQAYGK